jgi:hypothetical protein
LKASPVPSALVASIPKNLSPRVYPKELILKLDKLSPMSVTSQLNNMFYGPTYGRISQQFAASVAAQAPGPAPGGHQCSKGGQDVFKKGRPVTSQPWSGQLTKQCKNSLFSA